MRTSNDRIERILREPGYWIEGVNGMMYNSILDYMEKKHQNRTQLAAHLGISKGRVSQILNDGQINFSIEKLIEIALKIGKYPVFELKDAEEFRCNKYRYKHSFFFEGGYTSISLSQEEPRIISFPSQISKKIA
ncbi:helix-turn-helix domain-containing protein [Leadbetterella sp. DM7]|uniref:helix-turn-helix domain-containing protein n=1 Tax=Leadbetterella sp. DM7 TaxID=3235085 RepID=UPI00349E65A5